MVFDAPVEAQVFSFTPADGSPELLICVPYLAQVRRRHPRDWDTIEVPIAADDRHSRSVGAEAPRARRSTYRIAPAEAKRSDAIWSGAKLCTATRIAR